MSTTPYDVITDRIVEILQAGTVPWRRPWHAVNDAPRNTDGRLYRGINVFLLLMQGRTSPIWLTFNKATELGGKVRKGEHGTPVVFWKVGTKPTTDPDTGETKLRKTFVLRYYTVFNLEQVEGVKLPKAAAYAESLRANAEQDALDVRIAAAEAIIAAMPQCPPILWYGDRAFYRPSFDEVHLPPRSTFSEPEAVYSTLFHELGHSTGHKSRLNRSGITDAHSFGDEPYGREELVAEMTAAFLCGESGIAPATVANSAAYLASWVATIKADTKAVVMAAAQAQRAADFILNRAPAEAAPVTETETTESTTEMAA